MLTVMKHCYDALNYMNMLEHEAELLLLVALFHDYNHSMGRRNDAFNICEAKLGLDDFLKNNNLDMNIVFMYKIIDATQYPYIIKSEDLNIYQAIIRDADLLQIIEPDWISHVILGLSEEMYYPLDELMIGEKKFLRRIEFHTPYGKMMQQKHGKHVWDEFKLLENILK
jgi:hypothetical protein